MTKRPRSEDCQRLTLATVLPLVQPGAEALTLADGTVLALRWGVIRGCYGGDRKGRALLLVCPSCSRNARVLHRPPRSIWGSPDQPAEGLRPGHTAGCAGYAALDAARPAAAAAAGEAGKRPAADHQRDRAAASRRGGVAQGHRLGGTPWSPRWSPSRQFIALALRSLIRCPGGGGPGACGGCRLPVRTRTSVNTLIHLSTWPRLFGWTLL
jgi:hypothetical protein